LSPPCSWCSRARCLPWLVVTAAWRAEVASGRSPRATCGVSSLCSGERAGDCVTRCSGTAKETSITSRSRPPGSRSSLRRRRGPTSPSIWRLYGTRPTGCVTAVSAGAREVRCQSCALRAATSSTSRTASWSFRLSGFPEPCGLVPAPLGVLTFSPFHPPDRRLIPNGIVHAEQAVPRFGYQRRHAYRDGEPCRFARARLFPSEAVPTYHDALSELLAPARSGSASASWRGPPHTRLQRRTMDRLLTAGEVAEQLGVRPQWVWAQARAGQIPHVRLGRYRRFRESAIEDWVCELEENNRSPARSLATRSGI
jgi:excisionase family DNA binding protein